MLDRRTTRAIFVSRPMHVLQTYPDTMQVMTAAHSSIIFGHTPVEKSGKERKLHKRYTVMTMTVDRPSPLRRIFVELTQLPNNTKILKCLLG